MRKVACAFGLVLAVSATAAAQKTPKTDVFLGYSYVRVRAGTLGPPLNANGGSLSVAYNLNNFLGIVGDLGIYHAGVQFTRGNAVSYLFGPRFSVRRNDKITPYGQVLLGGAHISRLAVSSVSFNTGLESRNAFAMTVGGGVDAKLSPHLGLRLIQVEYFLTKFPEFFQLSFLSPPVVSRFGYKQNNVRISTGVVFRFGK